MLKLQEQQEHPRHNCALIDQHILNVVRPGPDCLFFKVLCPGVGHTIGHFSLHMAQYGKVGRQLGEDAQVGAFATNHEERESCNTNVNGW